MAENTQKAFENASKEVIDNSPSERLERAKNTTQEKLKAFKSAAIEEAQAIKALPVTDEPRKSRLEALRNAVRAIAEITRQYELAKNQVQDKTQVDGANFKELMEIQGSIEKELGQLSTSVVEQAFGLDSKSLSETTEYDEFLDMLRAINVLRQKGVQNPTFRDWKNAGHDGQGWFDQKELDEINAFYAKVCTDSKLQNMADAIVRASQTVKSDADLVGKVIDLQKAAEAVDKVEVETSDVVRVEGKQGTTRREKKNDKIDAIDAFFGGAETNLWGGSRTARDIIESLSGKDSAAKLKSAYKNVVGEDYPANTQDANALIARFQTALGFKIREYSALATKLAKIKNPKAREISGGTGLTAILNGKFDSQMQIIAQKVEAELKVHPENMPKPNTPEWTELLATAGRWGLPVLASVLTQGIVIGSYENSGVKNSEDFVNVSEKFDSKNQTAMAIVHDVFMGKRFSFDVGDQGVLRNFAEEVSRVKDVFDESTKPTSFLVNTTSDSFKKLSPAYQTLLLETEKYYNGTGNKNIDVAREALMKSLLVESAMRSRPGSWSFRASPLFIGAGYEGVKHEVSNGKNANLVADAGAITKELNLPKDISYKMEDGQYLWTIPKALNVRVADGVTVEATEDNGSVTYTSNEPIVLNKVSARNALDGTRFDGYEIALGNWKETSSSSSEKPQDASIDFTTVSLDDLVKKRHIRIALSNLPGVEKDKNNKPAARFSEAYGNSDLRDAASITALKDLAITLLNSSAIAPTAMKALAKKLKAENDSGKIASVLVGIRYGLMTDRAQAAHILDNTGKPSKKGRSKSQETTRNLIDGKSNISELSFQDALDTLKVSGIDKKDFKDSTPKGNHQAGEVNNRMIAMVGGWKMKPAGFTYQYPGSVDVAKEGGKERMSTTTNQAKKDAIYEAFMKNPNFKNHEFAAIKNAVDGAIGQNSNASETDIESLITTGKATIGGVEFTMNNTFSFFAYGACGNPSMGIEIGNISYTKNGKTKTMNPISQELEKDVLGEDSLNIIDGGLGISPLAAANKIRELNKPKKPEGSGVTSQPGQNDLGIPTDGGAGGGGTPPPSHGGRR